MFISDIKKIAAMYDKPVELVESILLQHGVTEIPVFRHPFDGFDTLFSDLTAYYNTDPSLTKQEFTDSVDPNKLLERAQRGQDISFAFRSSEPQYGDFTQVPSSYHEAITAVTEARQTFMQLDPAIRQKFGNDPARFLDFALDPKNIEELVTMGLATPVADAPKVTPVEPQKAPAEVSPTGGEGA